MFQNQINDQLTTAQAKVVETAKHLAQVAVESAKELAEINQAAAKDALVVAQDASAQLLAIKDAQQLAKLAQPEAAQEASLLVARGIPNHAGQARRVAGQPSPRGPGLAFHRVAASND